MSKLIDDLREIRIFNPWDMASDGMPIITYVPNDNSRGGFSSHWAVYFKNRKLKASAWYEHGGKHFTPYGSQDRDKVFQEALTFVKKLRPNIVMVKAPFRLTWIAQQDLEAIMLKLKQHKEGFNAVMLGGN